MAKRQDTAKFLKAGASPKGFLGRNSLKCISKATETAPAVTANGHALHIEYADAHKYPVGLTNVYAGYDFSDRDTFPSVERFLNAPMEFSLTVHTEMLKWAVKTAKIFENSTGVIRLDLVPSAIYGETLVITGYNEDGDVETPLHVTNVIGAKYRTLYINATYLLRAIEGLNHYDFLLLSYGENMFKLTGDVDTPDREVVIMAVTPPSVEMPSKRSSVSWEKILPQEYEVKSKLKAQAKRRNKPKQEPMQRTTKKAVMELKPTRYENRSYERGRYGVSKYDSKFLTDPENPYGGYTVPVFSLDLREGESVTPSIPEFRGRFWSKKG